MRKRLLPLVLLAAACQNGHPPPRPTAGTNEVLTQPAPAAAPARAANATQAVALPKQALDPAVADLSPAQRRAYELGYRDCSEGRYAPGNHLEAYRIGCAAAHDH